MKSDNIMPVLRRHQSFALLVTPTSLDRDKICSRDANRGFRYLPKWGFAKSVLKALQIVAILQGPGDFLKSGLVDI